MTPDELKMALLNGAGAIDARKKWSHPGGRSAWANASEIMSCIRMQWYEKNGEDGEEQDWGYARRGSHGEKYIREALRAANVPLVGEWTYADKDTRIAGTPDDRAGKTALEFKTIDPRAARHRLPRANHVVQVQIGMELAILDDVEIDSGVLLYMDASNYNDLVAYPVERDPDILSKLAPRAKKLLGARKASSLEREGIEGGDCKNCAFKTACGVDLEKGSSKARGNRGSALFKQVQHYVDLRAQEKGVAATLKGLKEKITGELTSRKTTKIGIGGYVVELQPVKGRASLDRKAVTAAGIDLSPFEKTGAPSTRLTIEKE